MEPDRQEVSSWVSAAAGLIAAMMMLNAVFRLASSGVASMDTWAAIVVAAVSVPVFLPVARGHVPANFFVRFAAFAMVLVIVN